MDNSDFDRLQLLFKRAHMLPELPGIATRLIHAVDSGDASALDLERIISADPILATRILRIANSVGAGRVDNEITTLRMAILKLGQKSVKALAMSLLVERMNSATTSFGPDPERNAHHSLFVGFLARYLFARRQQKQSFETKWEADEVFAAGILHDIAVPLLSQTSPEAFQRIHLMASRLRISYSAAFERIYKRPIASLAESAMESWCLPMVFRTVCSHFEDPWQHAEEFTALGCITYADYLAASLGVTAENWPVEASLPPEVENDVGLAFEEAAVAMELIDQQVTSYLDLGEEGGHARCA